MKIQAPTAVALLALAALTSGCDNDDNNKAAGIAVPDQGYLIGFRTADNPTADYILAEDDLSSGSISATGNGIEQEGWCYYTKIGETYFAMDYTFSVAKGYQIQDGRLKQVGQFGFERMDVFSESLDNKSVTIGAPWGGGSYTCKLQIVDGESISITKSVNTPIYEMYYDHETKGNIQMNVWPTAAWVKGSKLFVSFYPVVRGDEWETPTTDTAYVSVYSYPALEYQSTFKDTRTSPIGYYASQPCVLEDESGDMYTLSSSSLAAGFTQSTKPSGILRIKSGEEEFDEEYFFNTEELGYRVLTGVYVGDGKVVARVISAALDSNPPVEKLTDWYWASFSVTAAIHNIAVIDLEAQTLEIVDEVPLHGGQYRTPFLVENGKVWASVTTSASDAFMYEIDPSTATATKGARIEGSEAQSFFKY